MPNTHPIQCRCGQVQGLLKATRPSNRCVCYCTDCQAFARHLGALYALDGSGGTDIVQVPSSHLVFTQGADKLACLRLTDKGMLRWYSACCQTPMGNTPANWKLSFVGLIHTGLCDENPSIESSFGPVTMRVGVQSAIGADKPAARGLLSGIGKALAIVARGRWRGAYRASPFFHPQTGHPIAEPKVLSQRELAAAKHAA